MQTKYKMTKNIENQFNGLQQCGGLSIALAMETTGLH